MWDTLASSNSWWLCALVSILIRFSSSFFLWLSPDKNQQNHTRSFFIRLEFFPSFILIVLLTTSCLYLRMAPFFSRFYNKIVRSAADARRLGCQTRWAWLHGRRFQCGKERDPVGRSVLEAASMKKTRCIIVLFDPAKSINRRPFFFRGYCNSIWSTDGKKKLKYKIILQIFLENNRRKRKKKQKFDDVSFYSLLHTLFDIQIRNFR